MRRRRSFLGLACALVPVALLRAGPVEDAIVATMRLAEQPNYSWSATVTDDARTYDIDGQTVRGGFTRVKMPVINSVRRQLGRSVTDTQIELIFRGNADCVFATDTGWKTPDELARASADERDNEGATASSRRPLPGAGSNGSVLPGIPGTPRRPPEARRYSNLQLTLSHPHEELAVIVSSHQDFQVDGDLVSGSLTELGAQLLLVHDGQKELTPRRAGGTFRLWLRAGLVAKYQVRLEGALEIDTPKGRRTIVVHQATETLLKDIGTTAFEVPEEARLKLSR